MDTASKETIADVQSAAAAAAASSTSSASTGLPSSSGYKLPLRHIFNVVDLEQWMTSAVGEDFFKFIAAVNAAIHGQSNKCECVVNETLNKAIAMLELLESWVRDIKPIAQPMRYGNKAFRTWHQRLCAEGLALCQSVLPSDKKDAALELLPYLLDSFGNSTRIDYGTGHETTFMILVYCLAKLHLVGPSDLVAVGCKVFPRYLQTARALQRAYMLEPAGSHGVWSLDDYQFLAFVFGSAQLAGHPHIKPKSVHSAEVREGYARDYLYLSSIDFIYSVKQGAPFSEHSPVLYDISQLPSWAKVNDGLLKMYKGEVLSKLPVMQHLVFGTLFHATWEPSREPVPSESTAHALALTLGSSNETVKLEATALEKLSKAEQVPVDEPLMAVAPWVKSPPNVLPNPNVTTSTGVAGAAGGVGSLPSPGSSTASASSSSSLSASSAGAPRERAGSGMVAMMESFGTALTPLVPNAGTATAAATEGSGSSSAE